MEIIFNSIIVLLIVFVIAAIINGVEDYIRNERLLISFKESMSAVNVPVITLENNGKSLNFLIDTGADYSYLDINAVEGLVGRKTTKNKINIVTGGGDMTSYGNVTLCVNYGKHTFENTFVIADLTNQFKAAFKDNIVIHGVLGTTFLKKYKYKLDFDDLSLHMKK